MVGAAARAIEGLSRKVRKVGQVSQRDLRLDANFALNQALVPSV